MTNSEACTDLIKQFEGFSAKRYTCPAGKATIGYGHVIGEGEPVWEPMTEAQASKLLQRDLDLHFVPAVNALLEIVPISQNQFDALVSLAFNIGVGALRESTLVRKLNALDLPGAADEFLRWCKIGGKPSNGLLRRRAAERALFLKG